MALHTPLIAGSAIGQHPAMRSETIAKFGVVNIVPLWHCQSRTAQQGVQDEFEEGIRGRGARGLHGQHAGSGADRRLLRSPLQRAAARLPAKSSELRGGFIIPLVAVVAIILGILAATGGGSDRPHSP